MVPTLSSQTNLLLVESLTRTFTSLRPLRRGDIVTAINPVTKHPVCKRIVATEGQTVHSRVANLPQAALTRSISVSADASSVLSDEPHWVSIPRGHVWLVGDNEDRTLLKSIPVVPVQVVRTDAMCRCNDHNRQLGFKTLRPSAYGPGERASHRIGKAYSVLCRRHSSLADLLLRTSQLWPHPVRLDAPSVQHKLLDLRES